MSKRLYRSRRDKMIGGVAGGLSDYFDIDPTLVRVLFVVALFLGGSSVLAYIILWIVVPEEPIIFPSSEQETKTNTSTEEKSGTFITPNAISVENQSQKRRVVIGIILIVIGILFLADNFIPRIHFGDFWPLVLICIGLALLLNSKKENNIL